MVEAYRRDDVDFGARNADPSWRLPVAATFVIDSGGVIRARHVEPNHTARMEPERALDVLRALSGAR